MVICQYLFNQTTAKGIMIENKNKRKRMADILNEDDADIRAFSQAGDSSTKCIQSSLDQLGPHFPIPENALQTSLTQMGEDIYHIKESLDRKRPKVTLSDINEIRQIFARSARGRALTRAGPVHMFARVPRRREARERLLPNW